MSRLTERHRQLLRLVQQMSQNPNSLIDLDLDFNFRRNTGGTTPPVEGGNGNGNGNGPTTIEELLLSLVNEQVEVTTPFGLVTGTLIAVRNDYVVIIEASGDQVLVRTESIELVSDL